MSTIAELKRIVYKTIEETKEDLANNELIRLFSVENGATESYSVGSFIDISYIQNENSYKDFFYFEVDRTNNIYIKNAFSDYFTSPPFVNYIGNSSGIFLENHFYALEESS